MMLRALLDGEAVSITGRDVDVRAVTVDSRRAAADVLFVACAGATARSRDGHDFVPAAIAAGARAIVVEEGRAVDVAGDVTVVRASNTRAIAARLAERAEGSPSSRIDVIGVTGTNGKTTVTTLLAEALLALGEEAAVLGTLGVGRPRATRPLGFTTPEAEVLSAELRALADANVRSVCMEVSSHALATARVDGIRFAAAAFTNFTQDHLDFHPTMADYLRAKARLFDELLDDDAPAILPVRPITVDGASLARARGRALTWGIEEGDVRARDVALTTAGIRFTLDCAGAKVDVESALVGAHNVENLVVAGATLFARGRAPSDVARGLSVARGAPGRMERVPSRPSRAVLVDYAHTPDALFRAIEAVRAFAPGRVIVVFGCGGDRDRAKRPLMGAIAARAADVVVVTSDNPRSEPPESIVDAVLEGVRSEGMGPLADERGRGFLREVDRAVAIARAIALSGDGDVVLLAGKGHETTMTIGDQVLAFDDREVAARAMAGEGR